ncbi:MAG: GNAT family N-acetyltransferase [Rhodospirillales bacterium]|nr:GNAT family N-acetyltransferase [Rhodospirillales bacterium]
MSGLDILAQAYHRLYIPEFGHDEENESFEEWVKGLKDPKSKVEFHIAITGDNLNNPTSKNPPHIKGMSVSLYFKNEDVGYLSYIVVHPDHRDEGLGRHLFDFQQHLLLKAAKQNRKTLKGWFLDCTKPGTDHAANDDYGAERRLEKYKRWGGKEVPLSCYTLPSIAVSGKKITDWTLMTFPHPANRNYPETAAITNIIKALFKYNGINKPRKDPDYKAMKKEIVHPQFKDMMSGP